MGIRIFNIDNYSEASFTQILDSSYWNIDGLDHVLSLDFFIDL